MKKPSMKEALRTISEGINGIIDNKDFWSKEQTEQFVLSLQGVAEKALHGLKPLKG